MIGVIVSDHVVTPKRASTMSNPGHSEDESSKRSQGRHNTTRGIKERKRGISRHLHQRSEAAVIVVVDVGVVLDQDLDAREVTLARELDQRRVAALRARRNVRPASF